MHSNDTSHKARLRVDQPRHANSHDLRNANGTSLKARLRDFLGPDGCRRLGIQPWPPGLKLSVIIPVYNERATLRELVRRVREVRIPKEIIIVDDASTDGTREMLRELASEPPLEGNELRICFHDKNCGKGATLRSGFAKATGSIVLIQDADLEYNPAEYPELIGPIVDGAADVVFGSRFIGHQHRVLSFWHTMANRCLTICSNAVSGLNLTDMETCYKVFRRDVIDELAPKLKCNHFGFEPEITAKIARRGLRVFERPVSYAARSYREGKKIRWWDGLRALGAIIRYRFAD